MAVILKGAPVSAAMIEKLKVRADALAACGISATIAIVRVGERPDDIAYEKSAGKRCAAAGVAVKNIVLPESVSHEYLAKEILALNENSSVHGVLLLRPLPKHIDESAICELLSPAKDVDSITAASLSGVFTGNGSGYPPCTAQAVIETLDYYNIDITGKNVSVIGRSLVIGKPVSMLLLGRNATVTMCHTKSADLPSICRRADIIVAAAGRAGVVGKDFVSPGQIIIDVGINVDANGKLCGDVDFETVEPVVSGITPVPGGIGTVTSTILAAHVIDAAEKSVDRLSV